MLAFFPLDVLDEIWDVLESVSEGFLTYSCTLWRAEDIKSLVSSCCYSTQLWQSGTIHSPVGCIGAYVNFSVLLCPGLFVFNMSIIWQSTK